jgi:hypothetical protein
VISATAKAWVALVGAIVTALLGLSVIPVTGGWHTGLTIASAILTALATYAIPNRGTSVVPLP